MKPATLLLCIILSIAAPCSAATVVAYDLTAVRHNDPNCGGWCSSFNGTITPNASHLGYDDYSYGSGTLNDGYVGQYANNQLFDLSTNPTVTLYLDAPARVQSIDIYGWSNAFINNYIPGALSGLTVTIGLTSLAFNTTGFGPNCLLNLYRCNDRVDLSGSGLDAIATDRVKLSGFQMDKTGIGPTTGYVNMAEVVVSATPVPEPGTMLLIVSGVLTLALHRRIASAH